MSSKFDEYSTTFVVLARLFCALRLTPASGSGPYTEPIMGCNHSIVSEPFTVTHISIKARQLCRRSDFSGSDYEDLRQGMRLYLMERARLFDPVRGNLEAFVTKAIASWVAMQLRDRRRSKRCLNLKAISLERNKVEDDGVVTSLGDVLPEDDGRRLAQVFQSSAIEQLELRDALEHLMAQLNPNERALLICVAEIGRKPAAHKLGMSWRQVANVMTGIRTIFENSEIFTQKRDARSGKA